MQIHIYATHIHIADLLLLLSVVVDAAPVLAAVVTALPVQCCGIHSVIQDCQQFIIADDIRVELQLHCFSVPCCA